MAQYHIVEQGEQLSGIAARHGFRSFRTIWDDARNDDLRRLRRNPHVLMPGDRIYVPDVQLKKETADTTQRHLYKVLGPGLVLRILLKDLDDGPVRNTACRLEVEGRTFDLTTDDQGFIEQRIPVNAREGRLTVEGEAVPIAIGFLDPVTETSGQKARLNNLGYHAGDPEAADDDERFRIAVEEFQCDQDLPVNGICGEETRAKLLEAHGC